MAAAQIPNLNTLRRGGLRGRGQGGGLRPPSGVRNNGGPGGGGGAGGGGGGRRQPNSDEIICATDNDATTSRVSAVEAGYLDDPFAKLLSGVGEVARRLPLMNRGTYVRTTGIDKIVNAFLSSSLPPPIDGWIPSTAGRRQIISLGAGSDTRYFRLKQRQQQQQQQQQQQRNPVPDLVYHEIDLATNTRAKIARLRSAPTAAAIASLCGPDVDPLSPLFRVSEDGARLDAPGYHIHPCDLRLLRPGNDGSNLAPSSLLPGIDPTLPTLLISECCLIYLSPDEADAVLEYFNLFFTDTSSTTTEGVTIKQLGRTRTSTTTATTTTTKSTITPLAIVIYEPILPHDAFGRIMISNLTARGIHLQTLNKYADLREQKKRLEQHGFKWINNSNETRPGAAAAAVDIDWVWKTWIDEAEKERVDGLEWMDEVEEFVLLARHYCLAFGWRGFRDDDELWKSLPVP